MRFEPLSGLMIEWLQAHPLEEGNDVAINARLLLKSDTTYIHSFNTWLTERQISLDVVTSYCPTIPPRGACYT